MGLLILLGLAGWIATSVIVEAEIFRDVREAIYRLDKRKHNWFTYKLRYLIGCHMCTGIWVAAIIALFIPPIVSSGVVGWGLTALAIKGIAHLFLIVQKTAESVQNWLANDSILKAFGPDGPPDVNEELIPAEEVIKAFCAERGHETGTGWPEGEK